MKLFCFFIVFIVSGCASIPLSTMLKFSSYQKSDFVAIKPADIRAKIILDQPIEIDIEKVELGLEVETEAKNLLGIYSSLTDLTLDQSLKEFSGKNFSEFKEKLSEVLVERIKPISNEIKKLSNEIDYLDKILLDGQKKANEFASNKLKKMHEIVGF